MNARNNAVLAKSVLYYLHSVWQFSTIMGRVVDVIIRDSPMEDFLYLREVG